MYISLFPGFLKGAVRFDLNWWCSSLFCHFTERSFAFISRPLTSLCQDGMFSMASSRSRDIWGQLGSWFECSYSTIAGSNVLFRYFIWLWLCCLKAINRCHSPHWWLESPPQGLHKSRTTTLKLNLPWVTVSETLCMIKNGESLTSIKWTQNSGWRKRSWLALQNWM